MMVNQPTPIQLWAMRPPEFNKWRAENDIPKLFAFFKETLPGFEAWLATLPVDECMAMRVVPTGGLFKGDFVKELIRRPSEYPGYVTIECRDKPLMGASGDLRFRPGDWEILGAFEPYFMWAKKTLGRRRFFKWPRGTGMRGGTFEYGSWSGAPYSDVWTRANLLQAHTVLKLGQVEVPNYSDMGVRNLDFTDLDYLVIDKTFHGSSWKTISFSSCRGIKFKSAKVIFYTFHQCAMDDISIDECEVEGLYFENISRSDIKINESDVRDLRISSSHVRPFIRGSELRGIKYNPSRDVMPSDIATVFRLLRAAYKSSGLTREAADCYYNEKKFERKSLFCPFFEYQDQFHGMGHRAYFAPVIENYRKGLFDRRQLFSELYVAFKLRLGICLKPLMLGRLLRFRLRWLVSFFDNFIWGYGERPHRVVLWVIGVVSGYAVAFHALPWPTESSNAVPAGWFDDFYFSIVTFTTLGYGDILPVGDLLKAVCASEALAGAFSLGLIVAAFSNRNKY